MDTPTINPIGAATITGASGLLGGAVSAISNAVQNKKARKYNDEQYAKARRDALADWNMQNLYNHPSQVMERLKAAGLNPHLVYGNGAQSQGGIVRSTDTKSWTPQPLGIGDAISGAAQGAIGTYLDIQTRQLQNTNLDKQAGLMQAEQMLKEQALETNQLSQLLKVMEVDFKGKMNPLLLESTQLKMKEIINNMDVKSRMAKVAEGQLGVSKGNLAINQEKLNIAKKELDIRKMLAEASFQKTAQEILNMQAQLGLTNEQILLMEQNIKNAVQDGRAKAWENSLRERGSSPNDPALLRMGNEAIDRLMKILTGKY